MKICAIWAREKKELEIKYRIKNQIFGIKPVNHGFKHTIENIKIEPPEIIIGHGKSYQVYC